MTSGQRPWGYIGYVAFRGAGADMYAFSLRAEQAEQFWRITCNCRPQVASPFSGGWPRLSPMGARC